MSQVEILKQNGYDFLWIDGYLWMWNIPIEQELQKKMAEVAYGDVLVAGYGLGLVQGFLVANPKVDSVLTIEIRQEVVGLCREHYGEIHGKVIIGDFFEFLREDDKVYDCAIGDTWEDIIPERLEEYKRFKVRARELIKPDGKILAWGSDYFEYLIEKEKG